MQAQPLSRGGTLARQFPLLGVELFILAPLSLQVGPVADWEGVEGGGAKPPPAPPLLLIFPLLVVARLLLVVEVDPAAPNTDQFVLPGEKELFVVVLVTLPGQAERQQGHEVRH